MATVLYDQEVSPGRRLILKQGDLTEEAVDAIVNAANSALQHGGGVAGAIVRKGGRIIQEESNRIAPVPVGQAAMTGSGSLPCAQVIHAVGPRWGEGDEEAKLANAGRNSFALAAQHNFTSIALPAISSGIFGFPKERCAEILVGEALEYLESNPASTSTFQTIIFCLIDAPTVEVFANEFQKRFGPPA